jgi:HAD superfamily hydrolase (TIGR01509 family)
VLFDMDGTLADTEPLWMAAEFALADRHSAPWEEADAEALIGRSLVYVGEYMKRRMGIDLAPEEIVDALIRDVIAAVRAHGAGWRPGAVELLRACNAAEVPTALVTMSYRSLAQTLIEALPDASFNALVAGEDVRHGKPHPEPYRRAADLLGQPASHCVAIEDSPAGAESAEASGCFVIVVPNQVYIPLTPRRQVLDSLTGCTPADLGALANGDSTGRPSPEGNRVVTYPW